MCLQYWKSQRRSTIEAVTRKMRKKRRNKMNRQVCSCKKIKNQRCHRRNCDRMRDNRYATQEFCKTSVVADEAELVEAAFAVEKEAVKVAIDATVAIWRGHQLAIFDFVDGSAGVRKNDG